LRVLILADVEHPPFVETPERIRAEAQAFLGA
jgi:hypothetical protein